MDTRLVFLDHSFLVCTKGGTQEGRLSVPIGHGASQIVGVRRQGNPFPGQAEEMRKRRRDPKRFS